MLHILPTYFIEAKETIINKLSWSDDDKKKVQELVNKYPQKASKIDWNRINEIPVEQVIEILSKESKKEKKKQIHKGFEGLKEGIDFVTLLENEKYRIYAPLNHKAAAAMGKDTKWCISMANTAIHWESYIYEGIKFIFIFADKFESPHNIMAAAITTKPSYSVQSLWDSSDSRMAATPNDLGKEQLIELAKKFEIPLPPSALTEILKRPESIEKYEAMLEVINDMDQVILTKDASTFFTLIFSYEYFLPHSTEKMQISWRKKLLTAAYKRNALKVEGYLKLIHSLLTGLIMYKENTFYELYQAIVIDQEVPMHQAICPIMFFTLINHINSVLNYTPKLVHEQWKNIKPKILQTFNSERFKTTDDFYMYEIFETLINLMDFKLFKMYFDKFSSKLNKRDMDELLEDIERIAFYGQTMKKPAYSIQGFEKAYAGLNEISKYITQRISKKLASQEKK